MSAEKEVVNFWCNSKGYFTIHNLKANNKDAGILAYKENEILHIQVSCSITGTMDFRDSSTLAKNVLEEKFLDDEIKKTIDNFLAGANPKKILVLNGLSKSRKKELINNLATIDIELLEFEQVITEVFNMMDTQYYKDYTLRTMQLVKYTLFNDPSKLASIMAENTMTSSSRQQLISNMLDRKEILKEFRKTNSQRLASILKNSGINARDLAFVIGNEILNKKTRKTFLDSLSEQEKAMKISNKSKKTRKKVESLEKFF